MSVPLVSIIILNWNGRDLLTDCLSSVKRQTYPNLEVILVDNGSTDGSVDFVRENYPDLEKIIQNPTNLGFGVGNNIGIEHSKGKYIALLNNDTMADPYWIEALVKVAEADPTVGMLASKVLSSYKREIIDVVGHLIYKDGLNKCRGRLERDNGQYNQIEEVFFPSGCAALYRRAMLDQIGLFDEDFFAYGDDTDIGIRGRLAGWKCLYVPAAVVYHKYSISGGKYSPFKAFYVERNRIWIAVKYFPWPILLLNPYYTCLRYLYHFHGILRHKGAASRFLTEYSVWQLFLVIARAHSSAIRKLPRMWKKRKEIKKIRKVSKREIYSWFKRFGTSARELALIE